MHPHRHLTWDEAAGLPETSARLKRLPEGLHFPDDFPEPIRFDARRRRLLYRGFMRLSSHTFLRGCSPDPAYLKALERLFQDSTFGLADSPSRNAFGWWLAGAVCLALAAVAVWAWLR
jgi:hypothetical protein